MAGEARETAGVTTALLIAYLDAVGGADAVSATLKGCGLEGCEQALRDENTWVSWETKVELFAAAEAVLDNPAFLDEMASMALDLNVAGALKVALRTLGTPQLVYRNIVRANARFNGSHAMELLAVGDGHASVRYFEIDGGRRFHPLDCRYNQAMLPLIPRLFGLPAAQVTHSQCVADGADSCVYDLAWQEGGSLGRQVVVVGAGSAILCAASALLLPAALPVAIGVSLLGAGWKGKRQLSVRRERWAHLERQSEDDSQLAQRLIGSLQDLVSELDLDELVAKVTRNAQQAIGGREFALLVREGDALRCRTTSGLPVLSVAVLETWANATPRALEQAIMLDEVSAVEGLAQLSTQLEMPLRSLVSAPLVSRGEPFGLLVALGTSQHTFLPREVEIVESFAAQVAIALSNARRYGIEQSLAARDPLTGLLNHRSFHESVAAELARLESVELISSIVVVDLDGFKRINDQDGHAEGDRFLRAAALALGEACRKEDLAFRVGGDEFALLLPSVDEHGARAMAERVCGAIATLDPRTGASFGIAALRAGTKREEALALADARLYDAKRMTGTYRDPAGLSSSGVAAVAVLEAALAAHDGDTAGHSAEVALLADRVAARLGLDETERRLVRDGARLHDLGKLAIGVELLRKPEPLSDDEWALIRTHSDRGADILDASPELRPLSAIVRACHEHWDGGGYPAGRSGTEIPLPARIVAVCDAFEAMVSPRPYTASRTIAEAIAELQRRAGTQFDATVVEAFVAEVDRAAGGVTGARPEVTAPAP